MKINEGIAKKIFFSLSCLFFLLVVINFSPYSVVASCSGDFDCEHDIYGDGDEIWGTEFTCQAGNCEYNDSYLVQDCSDFNEVTCHNDHDVYKIEYTAVGTCCESPGYEFDESCRSKNERYCESDDEVREDLWTCDGGDCVTDGDRHIEYCSDDNEYFCDGELVMERLYECSGGGCEIDDEVERKDCSEDDGWYCENDYDLEYRDYTCSGGSDCDYTPTETISCDDDYGDRSFCGGEDQEAECRSHPEAHSLEWNEGDHDYSYADHGIDGYGYCNTSTPPTIHLSWKYSSQTDHNYKVADLQVSEYSNFAELLIDARGLGEGESPVYDYTIDNSEEIGIDFGEQYHWRVRVRDENEKWSDEGEYSWSESTFETDIKRASVDFSYSPSEPYLEESVHFNNQTQKGDSTIEGWSWDFGSYYAHPSRYSSEENPSVEFTQEGEHDVVLEVEDESGVICSSSSTINAGVEIPEWEEIDPFQ